jgi:hypothetical protein
VEISGLNPKEYISMFNAYYSSSIFVMLQSELVICEFSNVSQGNDVVIVSFEFGGASW